MHRDLATLARASYQAYVDNDRDTIEGLIAGDFHFTSPLDNRIDRATYFTRCWPNSGSITGFEFIHVMAAGDRVFVTYEGQNATGGKFRNTEVLTFRDAQLIEAEVYFGWSIPHEAPEGSFVNPP